jgi:hypothetical protein
MGQPAPSSSLFHVRRASVRCAIWTSSIVNEVQSRSGDGSAGDADYGSIGRTYSSYRRPDPSIAALINSALGDGQSVLNVGAGAGSYEPPDRDVTAVEPSASMRTERPVHLAVAIDAVAEELPFADNAFDAAMATFSVHQWTYLSEGLAELRRVTRGPVVLLTCDPSRVTQFWLYHYRRFQRGLLRQAGDVPRSRCPAGVFGVEFSGRGRSCPIRGAAVTRS